MKLKKTLMLLLGSTMLASCNMTPNLVDPPSTKTHFIVVSSVEHIQMSVLSKGKETTFAGEGELLFISAVLDYGYTLESFLVNGAKIEGSSFNMPRKDAIISATLLHEAKRIVVEPTVGGVIAVDKEEAYYADTLKITVTPEEGYYCVEKSVKANDHVIYKSPINAATTFEFAMPTCDIIITAKFARKA